MSLHAIDAGDLSLTLGLTQIRLRTGKALPRCKIMTRFEPVRDKNGNPIYECKNVVKFKKKDTLSYVKQSLMIFSPLHHYVKPSMKP